MREGKNLFLSKLVFKDFYVEDLKSIRVVFNYYYYYSFLFPYHFASL
jgi:hypothetical protein